MILDPFSRRQPKLQFTDLYPQKGDGLCACGCGLELKGRQTRWATKACTDKASEFFSIIKGDSQAIRSALYRRDQGVCADCGIQSRGYWDADHIVPVHRGGGGCGLDNFQTLCPGCHKEKTIRERKLIAR